MFMQNLSTAAERQGRTKAGSSKQVRVAAVGIFCPVSMIL